MDWGVLGGIWESGQSTWRLYTAQHPEFLAKAPQKGDEDDPLGHLDTERGRQYADREAVSQAGERGSGWLTQ